MRVIHPNDQDWTLDVAIDALAEVIEANPGLWRGRSGFWDTTDAGWFSYVVIDHGFEQRRRERQQNAGREVTLYGIQRDDGALLRERGGLVCLRDRPYHPAALQDGDRNVKVQIKIVEHVEDGEDP